MIGDYKVHVSSPAGTLLAVIDNFISLQFNHALNNVDYCTINLEGFTDWTEYFSTNSIIEVWRKVPGYMPNAVPADRLKSGGWYVEWDGLHTDQTQTTTRTGYKLFTGRSDGFIDFLSRREILWYSTQGASESKKVATPAQTAMYEFVLENCGASALEASGRFIDGVITGFAVPVLVGNGDNWSGTRSARNVLETLQDIANVSGIDFDVIGQGGASWAFQTYPDQIGKDRTFTGIDTVTGLNSAGNVPVIFAFELDTMESATKSSQNRDSKNVIVALGQGQYDEREYALVQDAGSIDADRINQRELTRNANTQSGLELTTYAEEQRDRFLVDSDFTFIPRITESTIYGVDYWWTDKMTARFEGQEEDKRLTGISILVNKQGERFQQWQFETIPRT